MRYAGEVHVVHYTEDYDQFRTMWECECGHAGSCPIDISDITIEKHVPDEANIVFRYIKFEDWNTY